MARGSNTVGLTAVPLKQVKIDDGFWAARQRANREAGIPHQLRMCEETGRINNLRRAGGKMGGGFEGLRFNDSDVHKWLEAASHSLATHPDPALETKVDDLIDIIAAAQEPDGYINSSFTLMLPEGKWRNLGMLHELYTIGHLIEAAVAHYEATGKRSLLDVGINAADLVYNVFGPGKREGIPGHEEIELALVGLYRATGDGRYLEQAKLFVDRRGKRPAAFETELQDTDPSFPGHKESRHFMFTRDGKYDGSYVQDHLPLREQTEVVGHAVRAMYLFSGATDVAAESGDAALIGAMGRLWDSLTQKRLYVTGGMGPSAGNEGFTRDYDLPNEAAYAETCAAIGLIFWAHRLAMLHGESRFVDAMELALYNGALSGISLDGTEFFYVNPLENDGSHRRKPWYDCACCPPNIARLIASLGKYVYATSDAAVWVDLYISGEANAEVPGVGKVRISQESDYPWSGGVKITVEPEAAGEFAVNLRVPGWCSGASARVNREEAVGAAGDNGYLCLRRTWKPGDSLELSMPMEVRCIQAHPSVRHDAGRIALQRGPIVYCFEGLDNPVPPHNITITPETEFGASFEPDLLGGVVVLRGEALADDTSGWEGALYRDAECARQPVKATAIPYYAWANREPSPMAVWMRT